jgi:hypothetical protein
MVKSLLPPQSLLLAAKRFWIFMFGANGSGRESERLVVRVGVGGCEVATNANFVDIELPAPSAQIAAPEGGHATWHLFTPLEEKVVKLLQHYHDEDAERWTTGEQIAELLLETHSGAFKVMLTNLAERNVLVSLQRHGYKINLPSPVDSPD